VHRDLRSRTTATIATVAATVLVSIGLTALPAEAATVEHISNGTFTSTTDPWWGTTNLTISATGGQLCTQVPAATTNVWDAIVGYSDIPLVTGDSYTLKFDASASVATKVKANVQLSEDPYTTTLSRDTALTATKKTFTYTFTSTLDSTAGSLQFQIGGSAKAWKFCLDNVSLTSKPGAVDPNGPQQVRNGTFDDGTTGWYSYGTSSMDVTDGRLCSVVPTGLTNLWDAGVGQNDITLVEGANYVFSFEASASPGSSVRAAVQLGVDPYTAYFGQTLAMTATAKKYSYTFTASASTTAAQVAFQVGGASAEYTFCVDNVSLRGGGTTA
jgi:endoglucanase